MSGPIAIGFTFNYYGINYTNVHISSNGFLSFLSGQTQGCCSGQSIPSSGNPDAIIAAWWDDLFPPGAPAGGGVHTQLLGTAPNRRFIVQFTDVPFCCNATPVTTHQYKLFEGSDIIEVHYALQVARSNHSAGIENETGTIGLQYSFRTPLSTPVAVQYSPEPDCFVVDAIDDQFAVINDGTSTDLSVLPNDECTGDQPISVVTLPGDLMPDRGGSATTDGATVSYTPAAEFVGFEEFTYTAQDAGLDGGANPPTVDQDTATVVVNVLENLIPDAVDDEATTLQSQPINIAVLENDSLGNEPSEIAIETAPANGTATLQPDDTIRYSPNFGFFGEDSFEYRLTDANGDSDVATVTVGVFFVQGTVPIDIMPNDAGNNINLRAGQGSGFEVAILSVGEFFDAPTLIDPLTLKLGPRQANIWGTPRVRDVDGDGYDDLVVKFLTQQTGIACGDSHANLSGRTFEFRSISGSDMVNTFNCPRVRKRH
jgi:hypothetical protein